MNKKRKRILALVLAELFLLALIGGALFYFAGGHQAPVKEDHQTAQTEVAEETPVTLLFASDFQKEDGWDDPAVTLGHVIDAAQADGKTIDKVIICGDYSNVDKRYDYQISPEEGIGEIKDVVSNKIPSAGEDDMLFVQGNHDALTASISESGLHEYDDYLVYVLNTQGDYPWRQGMTAGSLDKVKKSSQELKECLDGLIKNGETRPLIIAGHVPLHFTARTSSRHTTGDNLYSSLIFDVVNDAAKSLDIIYLFGHNHSKGWDCYLGGSCVFRTAGDEILIPRFSENDVTTDEFSEEILRFTYLNAGYVGYYMNCGPEELKQGTKESYDAADMALTGTICEIYKDKVVLTRYDTDGKHCLGDDGCGDPYKGGIDADLIPETHYSKTKESPQIVRRKNNSF